MELGIMNRPEIDRDEIQLSGQETEIDIPEPEPEPNLNPTEKEIQDILKTQTTDEKEVSNTLNMINNYKTEDNDRSSDSLFVATAMRVIQIILAEI